MDTVVIPQPEPSHAANGFDQEEISALRNRLIFANSNVAHRMRTVFALKGMGTDEAAEVLCEALKYEKSVLVLHEICYVLGQMGRVVAIPTLIKTLEDRTFDSMVRHEAAEALGAIGDPATLAVLRLYEKDEQVEVAETCQIAANRIEWAQSKTKERDEFVEKYGVFTSVDPAPATKAPKTEKSVAELRALLLSPEESLFKRYTAMFALRNIQSPESILVLCEAFNDKSALFRHEVAFVLGQLADSISIPALRDVLNNPNEHCMVRHEAAEALGAIATPECDQILAAFRNDSADVVRESCEVALDISDYNNSSDFHYTDHV